jgi:ABC transport system ATP-binding/permease protein
VSLASLENATRQYRTEPILDKVTLGVAAGEKVGLIGANGCGKSTLLRLLAGVEQPDSGRRVIANHAVVAYLSQNPPYDPDHTVLQAVFAASTETALLLAHYEATCKALETEPDPSGELLARLEQLAARLEACGAGDLETRARTVLNHLGITDLTARMGELSGGQRKRVALAHALIEQADLLLLDEPTNHLDTAAVAWLERYLQSMSGALVLVTHDRYFLDRVTQRTLEVERGGVSCYQGGYSAYLESKSEQLALAAASEEKRANLMRRELEWLRRGARARTTKQKARIERAEALIASGPAAPQQGLEMAFASRRLGGRVIELKKVSKSYPQRTLIRDLSYELGRGDRVGIVGPNGLGKTTLLEILSGRLAPDSGSVEHGSTVSIGYYDQESRELDDNLRVIDYIRNIAEIIPRPDGRSITAAQMLERFLFAGAVSHAPIGRLSGGEKKRLYLLGILMANPNVLILDEPTNDLDIPTLQRLEDYLDGFTGCLVVVSHDRYFLDRTVQTILHSRGDGHWRAHAGTYSECIDKLETALEPLPAPTKKGPAAPPGRPQAETVPAQVQLESSPKVQGTPPTKSRKKTMREKREMEALEAEIEAAETRLRQLDAELSAGSSDYHKTQVLFNEQQALTTRLETCLARWSELAEIPE